MHGVDGAMTILLVREQPAALETLQRYVAACYPAGRITAFTDSNDALKLIQAGEEKIDLCFAEARMRGVSGFRLVEELRRKNHRAKTVFIAEDDSLAMAAWTAGVNDYLLEPVTMESVRHTLRSCAPGVGTAGAQGQRGVTAPGPSRPQQAKPCAVRPAPEQTEEAMWLRKEDRAGAENTEDGTAPEKKEKDMPVRLKTYLVDFILYGGITKEEYQSILPRIREKNGETLRLASVMCALMFLALLLGSFFSESMAVARLFYGAMLTVCAAVSVLSFTLVRRRPGWIMPLWYLLFMAFAGYAGMLNTFIRPELSATTICVFLVIGPMLLIDSPCRVVTFQLVLSAGYILCAIWKKDPYLAFADSVNVACCVFLGAAIYLRLTRVKLREAMQARKLQEERDTDKLTGLLNKAAMERQASALLSDPQQRGALMVMDIDNFKQINDTYGHAVGDIVLGQMAGRIREMMPGNSLCSRFGGDEFLLLVPDLSEEDLAALLDALLKRLRTGIAFPDTSDRFSVSIGAVRFPQQGKNYEQLFRCADTALYEAKAAGKNCWRLAGSPAAGA